MYILEQTNDAEGVEIFRMSEGPQVFVSDHLVGFVGGHPSGVDYYYEERGYGCQSRREVAIVFASEQQPAPAVQGQMFPQGDDLPLFTAPADVDQDEWITRLAQNIHDSQPALFWPMPERDQVADIYYWLLDHDGALDTSAAGILALADQYAAQIDR